MKRIKFVAPAILGLLLSFSAAHAQEKGDNPAKEKPDGVTVQKLIAELDTIHSDEQTPVRERDRLMEKYGAESDEAQAQQRIYQKNHAANEEKVSAILDKYGWLGSDIIGERGNATLYLVVQHSPLATRQKYLPMLRESVKKGKTPPRFLANVQDRINTNLGKPQVYGEQWKYYPETKSFNVWPVLDPANIDKRRAEIGLVPIAEHLKRRFNFEWKLDEQIKRTEEFLKKVKED